MPRYHVTIYCPDYEALADLTRRHGIDVIRQTARAERERGGYAVSALADTARIRALKEAGYQVEQHENVDRAARASLSEVGQGNRYADRLPGRRRPETEQP
jgi:hypothetical protein